MNRWKSTLIKNQKLIETSPEKSTWKSPENGDHQENKSKKLAAICKRNGVHPNFAKIPGSDRKPVVVENENKRQHRVHQNLPTLLCR